MIVYEHNHKNKFPHMVLISYEMVSYGMRPSMRPKNNHEYSLRKGWLMEHCGEHNVAWTKTMASIYNGKKLYWEAGKFLDWDEKRKIVPATQYGFKSKDHAMHFMLRFSNGISS